MLNSKQILEQGIITGPIEKDNIQQVGIDLNVIEIKHLYGGGVIPHKGKTVLGHSDNVLRENGKDLGLNSAVWTLTPGAYSVTFEQGCNIPSDKVLLIRQRSSLLRNGSILHSSIFDPGFSTEQMGTVLIVHVPIAIEFKARIAQGYVHECSTVSEEDLYDGQFQNDKQRGS